MPSCLTLFDNFLLCYCALAWTLSSYSPISFNSRIGIP